MSKKLILILVVVLLALGGGGYVWWMKQGDKGDETKKAEEHGNEKAWNLYATDASHIHTLGDLLISASKGDYLVKMTVSLDFKDDEAYMKFQGYASKEEAEKALKEEGGGHGGGGEEHLTPMEVAYNDAIGQLMLNASDEQIHDKALLKTYLHENLYKQLKLADNNLHGVYIENYVIQ